jgi:hypothetical protein
MMEENRTVPFFFIKRCNMRFIKKEPFKVKLILLTLFFSGLFLSDVSAKDMCIDCHKDDKFQVQNKIVYDYYNNWKDSIHDLSGVTCTDCHGGDPTKADIETAHKDNFSSFTERDKESFKKIPQICGRCHEAVLKNFVDSKHYKAVLQEGTGPHCATCHGSVNTEVYYTSIIGKACRSCHNEETKNLPQVGVEAEEILQNINVARAYRNWALIFYTDKETVKLKEINALYRDITDSWHKFDFARLKDKSRGLLNSLKSIVNKGLAGTKKEIKQDK